MAKLLHLSVQVVAVLTAFVDAVGDRVTDRSELSEFRKLGLSWPKLVDDVGGLCRVITPRWSMLEPKPREPITGRVEEEGEGDPH